MQKNQPAELRAKATRGKLLARSDKMGILSNPYFLGYVLLILVLVRCGNAIKALHNESVARRKAAEAERHRIWDGDL